MEPMTDLQRFHACLNYQPVDRCPFWAWGGWPETMDRWLKEGWDPATNDLSMGQDARQWLGGWYFPNPPFEHKVVDEDETHVLYINHEGILMREFKNNPYSSMPQFIRFPVETREDFRTFWKERMNADIAARLGPDWKQVLQGIRQKPGPFIIIADRWGGFFGPLRNLVGVQRLCTLFYDDPAFLEEMMEADADFMISLTDQILDEVKIDVFGFWEDMGFNTAPLLSPRMARKYMLPRYKRVVEHLRGRGVPWICLDSDGRIDSLIPIWVDAGINCLYPFEYQAGEDVLAVRKQFGKDLRLWGGVDKRTLAWGKEAIDAELERVRPLIEEGGYIPHPDHSIPPDVPFQNYIYFMERLMKVCSGE